jgi:hypothetical protein
MRHVVIVALAGVLVAGAGCNGNGNPHGAALSVSAKAVTAPPAPAAQGGLDLGAGITVERVRLALREIGLEATAATSTSTSTSSSSAMDSSGGSGTSDDGSQDGSDDPGEVKVGPFLVDLSGAELAGGALSQVFDADVPAGTYRELRIVVGPVDPAGAPAGLADLNGSSVVIAGTIDGAPFTFSSRLTSAQKRESTLVVGASGASSNVTLTVSPAGWFTARDGSRLDPTVDANRPAIEANLRASIDAFADDDADGHEDGGGHGGDDPAAHR